MLTPVTTNVQKAPEFIVGQECHESFRLGSGRLTISVAVHESVESQSSGEIRLQLIRYEVTFKALEDRNAITSSREAWTGV